MNADPDEPSFSNLVDSLRADDGRATGAPDPPSDGDQVAVPSKSVNALEPTGRQVRPWMLGGGLVVALLLAAGGFVLPWVVLDHGTIGPVSYSAIDLPVGNYVGVFWLVCIVVMALTGWLFRWTWALVIGTVAAGIGVVVFLTLALLLREAPHLIPVWLLPKDVRGYVPSLSTGIGVWLPMASCVVFVAWFVGAGMSRPKPSDPEQS